MEELAANVFNVLMNPVNDHKLRGYALVCPAFSFHFKEFMKNVSRYETPGPQRVRPFRFFHPAPPGTLFATQLTKLRDSDITFELVTAANAHAYLSDLGKITENNPTYVSFEAKFLPFNQVSDESDKSGGDEDDICDNAIYDHMSDDDEESTSGLEGNRADAEVNPGLIASLWGWVRKWTAGGTRDRNDENSNDASDNSNKRQRTRY